MTIKLGDANDTVLQWRQVMNAMFGGTAAHPGLYARLHGPLPTDTNVFGERAVSWQKEYQVRTGQAASYDVASGIVSDADLLTLKVVIPYRPIWCYSAPGSGAPWSVGPPFDIGEWAKQVLHINHQPVGYPIGGYLGLLGGDPANSYLDIYALYEAEQLRLLGINPDVQRAMTARATDPGAAVDVELWFAGYSQSADFMLRFLNTHFGDGGQYAVLRDRINGVLLCGNPGRQPGRTKVGNTPVGWGISRIVYPAWLNALTWSITVETPAPDFYAADADEIRPLFYEWFIRANTSLSFVIYSAQIIIPAILNLVAPFLGGLAGLGNPLAATILGAQSGLPIGQISQLLGGIMGSTEQPDPKLIELLSVKGVLTNLPQLLTLLGDIQGVAAHGDYYTPRAEFGNRNGVQVACDVMAAFRR
ncbi:peptidoglycan-binding protein [Mycobacterium colombiense]